MRVELEEGRGVPRTPRDSIGLAGHWARPAEKDEEAREGGTGTVTGPEGTREPRARSLGICGPLGRCSLSL